MKAHLNNSSLTLPIFEAYLLGSPEFRLNGEVLPLIVTRKTLSLLAYLLLHSHLTHSREKLAALFWGDVSDQQARHSLRTALASLRKELGVELFITDRETVQINTDISILIDALQLEKVANATSKGELRNLQDAIALYRGDLLTDFYDDWILRERDHFRNLYLDLLLQMTHLMRSRSEYARAIYYAERALESDPANERAHQHLIFCHLANGDRSAAVRQYEDCSRVLQEELAVEPSPETTALYQWLRQAPVKAIEARITNLPIPLTSFIGRTREMARVKDMLAQARLVTLTGSGGCGKTRLAIQVASDLVDSFRDGVWWVDFAPLVDEALVSQTIAKVVGVHEASNTPMNETLVNYLRPRNLLLVLDNCEHLVGGIAGLVMVLLSACEDLNILTTSRESLDIPGETILRVPSLSFPMSRHLMPGEKLEDYESGRLLLERAVVVKPDFDLSGENAAAVAQICRRLDGIPLAIELAAARLKVLPIGQIAARLDDRFSLLTAGGRTTLPRHQTLRAVVDWSYNLLSEKEQAFLCRLSVFAGGWALEAAQAVCAEVVPPNGVIDLMASLVDKSLVEVAEGPGSAARYRMLETMRQYGLERLREAGQVEATRGRHALFFAELAEKAEQRLRDPEMHAWIERLEADHDNFRAALEWSLAQESPQLSLRFAGALGIFWRKRGYLSEGRTWLESMLARSRDAPPSLRAKAMAPASWLERDLGNYERAAILQEESLRILRATGDQLRLVDILIQGGLLAVYQNDPQRAFASFTECLAISEELDYRWGCAMALVNLGHAALFNLQWDAQARSRCEEALKLFKELDDETEQAHALIILGAGAHYENDDPRGRRQLEQAVTICRQAGDKRQLAWATTVLSQMIGWLDKIYEALPVAKEGLRLAVELGEKTVAAFAIIFLALLLKGQGEVERSLRLISCGIAYGNSFGYRLSPYMWDAIYPELDAMRSILDEQAFTKVWSEGEVMSFETALQDALGVSE
jgi:predicted ATPase/DNA-binding SARP family transcriptional activator